MRGVEYGEFDHVTWITMKKDGPVLANLLLDGILKEDLSPIITHRLPLSEFATAFDLVASGHAGKVVLLPQVET